MYDWDSMSPYNVDTMSCRQVMRIITKNVNWGTIGWSNTKFSTLISYKLYGRQLGELVTRSWDWKG